MDTDPNHALIIRLIAAVSANCHPNPDGTLKINATLAYEMVEKVLLEHEVAKIRRSH